jgi:hypothetical protein
MTRRAGGSTPLSRPRVGKGRVSKPARTRLMFVALSKLRAGAKIFPLNTTARSPHCRPMKLMRCSIGVRKRRSRALHQTISCGQQLSQRGFDAAKRLACLGLAAFLANIIVATILAAEIRRRRPASRPHRSAAAPRCSSKLFRRSNRGCLFRSSSGFVLKNFDG